MPPRAAGTAGFEGGTRAFLESLAAGGGKPLEQLSPGDARQVLVGAQAGIAIDRSKTDAADRTITVERQAVKLKVVRPAGMAGPLPVFMFFHGGGRVNGRLPAPDR